MIKTLLSIIIFSLVIIDGRAQMKNPVSNSQSNFNQGWEFVKDMDTMVSPSLFQKNSPLPLSWKPVSLPHTAQIEALTFAGKQWQGTCFYRKFFHVPAADKGQHVAVRFDAAMHEAEVYLNGTPVFKHIGGYLPFEIDLSRQVKYGAENCILVKLNNQDNPVIPPGKPIKDLDFNYYGGLYRNAYFLASDQLRISDAVKAGHPAAGGIRVNYDHVSRESATVTVQTEVQNDYPITKTAQIRLSLLNSQGKKVAEALSNRQEISKGHYRTFSQKMQVKRPDLWSPTDPYLYTLSVEVLHEGKIIDRQQTTCGIRTLRFTANEFYLNGAKFSIRGTNRHQEYPYIGYALSDHAQYRDAWKIKEAGFNFVRCSHYPPSPAFLDACDELGILVMDAIPGWQFFGEAAFQENSWQDVRDLVRRDRNHPSIILWEASLNESGMSQAYMAKAHQLVHEEMPFADVYTCGWMDNTYDVFIPARQHAKPPAYWSLYDKNKPLLIAEYGDWEYYAQNAGFNQKEFGDLKESERSSRQLRGDGEKRLAQQALNFQEAHNDNQKGRIVGDANWLMFDYNRGYAPDIESSGVMDMFRLPKFSFYFYQSQYGPTPDKKGFGKPMVYLANYWTPSSSKEVIVYSNCEEVALWLNDQLIARQKPDQNPNTTHLAHPPFTFSVPAFVPGQLKAIGYLKGQKAVETERTTPGKPERIQLSVDQSGKDLNGGSCDDVVFVYASVVDARGTVVPDATHSIRFWAEGEGELIGGNPIQAEAGTAAILLKKGSKPGAIKLSASADGLPQTDLAVPAL